MTTSLNPSYSARARGPSTPSGTPSLRDLLNTVGYYRRLIFTVIATVLLLGIVAAFLIPPLYSARARLLTLGGGVYEFQPANPNNAHEVESPLAVDVEFQLLESSELHRSVVRREVGPKVSPEVFEKRLIEFEDHLKVSKLETGNVIELRYRDRSPQHAADELRALLSAYFNQRAEVLTSGRVGFLTDLRDKTSAQLRAANAQIESYEQQNGIVNVEEQIRNAVTQDGVLRQQKDESDDAVAEARRSTDVLQANAESVPRDVELYSDNSEAVHALGTMESELFTLQAKRADLASRYMASSPFVKQADAQIATLTASIRDQIKQLPVARRSGYNVYKDTATDRLAQAKAALAGGLARQTELRGQVQISKRRLQDLIAVNDQLARLTAQRDQLADAFKEESGQLEQARIQQNQAMTSGTTNVRVIEAPTVPRRPLNPRPLFLAAVLLAALFITAVVVVIAASLRETFLSPFEAEKALGLPVLCDVAPRNATGTNRRWEFGRVIAALDSVPTGPVGKTLLLLSPQDDGELRYMARGLVDALEPRSPGRVALVHMDEEAMLPADVSELDDAMNSEIVMNLGMTMTRARLTSLFNDLRTEFDYVVLTSPPTVRTYKSLELTTVADFCLLVLNAETTRGPVAYSVLAQAEDIGGKIDALGMTGRRMHIPSWLYGLVLGRGKTA